LQGDRKTNIEWIIHNAKKTYVPYPDKQDKINELKEKIDKENKDKKSHIDKIMDQYKKKGSLPKNQRSTVVADFEFMGQRVPFCNQPKKTAEDTKEEGSKAANKKISYSTLYPNVRDLYKLFH